ncbi:low temperature requirement protein A [Planctomycetota bacterium]|nr:low temperature requirement protein A [Planctomycetota bacterium]
MKARDPQEEFRSATTLELLFDLCFVVAIALAAHSLHHAVMHEHFGQGIAGYITVFFAIWWAWMGHTWFASAYDTDDAPYRLCVLIQMVGVLVMAAGIPRAAETQNFGIITLGFVIMRIGLIALWVRAGRAHVEGRAAAYRFAAGLAICQIGWVVLWHVVPDRTAYMIGFGFLVVVELLVPVWAASKIELPWHAHHIAERYGLLTIIVIGESVLAATMGLQAAIDSSEITAQLWSAIIGSPLIMFSMWWLYFLLPAPELLTSLKRSFIWGYGHAPIFASAAAVGAGLAIAADHASGKGHISTLVVGLSVGVPVAIFLLTVWFFSILPHRPKPLLNFAFVGAAAGSIVVGYTDWPVLAIGLILTALVLIGIGTRHK